MARISPTGESQKGINKTRRLVPKGVEGGARYQHGVIRNHGGFRSEYTGRHILGSLVYGRVDRDGILHGWRRFVDSFSAPSGRPHFRCIGLAMEFNLRTPA